MKGDDLLEQIKPILKRCLQGLSWWDKMKDPKENWGTSQKAAKKDYPLFCDGEFGTAMANLVHYITTITKNETVIHVFC